MAVIIKLLLMILVIKYASCQGPQVNILAQMRNLMSFGLKKFEDRPQGFFSRLRQENVKQQFKDVYDYVIVGAGPSGCVLANRLSEDPTVSVLLIEAGEKVKAKISNESPMSAPNLQNTDYNWAYETVRQEKACLGMEDQKCNFPHGKGLGGSSIMNYLIYSRGNRRDFDNWEKAGISGWSYKDVLPFFKKSEKSTLRYSSRSNHGMEGELPVEDVPYRTIIAETFVKSGIDSGYNYVDYNAGDQIGVSYVQSNTKNGWRVDAAEAFLAPIRDRKNLDVVSEATAYKLNINRVQKTAKSVFFYHNKKKREVKARREIILSAGAFESPKLLMLSGIGPAQDLRKLGIEVIQDLPVGREMYDHVGVFGPIFTIDEVDELTDIKKILNVKTMGQFFLGKGPFTMNGIESLMYFKTNVSEEEDPGMPDIEVMQSFATLAFDTIYKGKKNVRMSDQMYNAVFKPLENKRAFQFLSMLLHPKSKGTLKLASRNPFDHPILSPNYFDDERDLETLVAGIKEIIRVASTPQFQAIGAKLYKVVVPGCEDFTFNTDGYWKCYCQHLTATFHHQVATTKMGPAWDNTAIVDERLRVYGIKNLRIADIGIIPQPPSGHTSAFSYLIGEKAAAMIKEDWTNKINRYEKHVVPYISNLPYLLNGMSRIKRGLSENESTTKRRGFDWQFDHRLDVSKELFDEFKQDRNKSKIILKGSRNDPNIIVLKKLTADQIPNNSAVDDVNDVKDRKQHFSVILHPTEEEEEYKKALSRLKLLAHHHHIHHEHFKAREILTTTEKKIDVTTEAFKDKSSITTELNGKSTTLNELTTEHTTTEKSHIDIIVDNLPSASEDQIKTLVMVNGSTYGKGLAKPRIVTEILHHMNTTEYKEEDNLKINETLSAESFTEALKVTTEKPEDTPESAEIKLQKEIPPKLEIKIIMVSSSESKKSEDTEHINASTTISESTTEKLQLSTESQLTTTEDHNTTESAQSSTQNSSIRPKRTIEEFERFGQASKIFRDGYKHFSEDIMTSNKHFQDFATSFDKFARSKRSSRRVRRTVDKADSAKLTEMVSVLSEEFKHFEDESPILNNRFMKFVESLNEISKSRRKRSLSQKYFNNDLTELSEITDTFSTKLSKFNDDVLVAGNDFKGFMSALYKFSELKDQLMLNKKDLSSEQQERIHKMTKIFEDGFQNFNDEILLMGDHLVEIFGSVEKFSRMKRDVSVVTLKPIAVTTESTSKIEKFFGKSWENIKNGSSNASDYLKEVVHLDHGKTETTTKINKIEDFADHKVEASTKLSASAENVLHYSRMKRDISSTTTKPDSTSSKSDSTSESSSKIGKFLESSWGNIKNGTHKATAYIKDVVHHDHEPSTTSMTMKSDKSETTTKVYHARSWFHHDIQEPKIRDHVDHKAKRDVTSTTSKMDNHSTTESSSIIGKFFESSWGSIKNGTAKVTNYIKEKVTPDNDVQKIETTTKFHVKPDPKTGPPIIHMA